MRERKERLVGLTTQKVSEPKWLTSDIKKFYDYKVIVLPNGMRLTELHAKRKKR